MGWQSNPSTSWISGLGGHVVDKQSADCLQITDLTQHDPGGAKMAQPCVSPITLTSGHFSVEQVKLGGLEHVQVVHESLESLNKSPKLNSWLLKVHLGLAGFKRLDLSTTADLWADEDDPLAHCLTHSGKLWKQVLSKLRKPWKTVRWNEKAMKKC